MKALTGCLLIASLANTGVAEVYFGGGIGRTEFDTSVVDDSTGFNLRGGWQYNPYIAFEASYWDTGDADNLGFGDVSADAFLFGGRFSTDIRHPFQAYTRVGMGRWDGSAPGGSESGTDLYYAIGGAYTADMARYYLELQTIEVDSDGDTLDINSISAGFEYRCCGKSQKRYSAIFREGNNTTYSYQPVSRPANYVPPVADGTPETPVIIEDLDVIATDSPEPQTVSDSQTFPVPSSTAERDDSERIHPMKIAINEGCNVMSVKIVDDSEVWDLFCPKTLQRLTVTL
jgi:hypothetical protein